MVAVVIIAAVAMAFANAIKNRAAEAARAETTQAENAAFGGPAGEEDGDREKETEGGSGSTGSSGNPSTSGSSGSTGSSGSSRPGTSGSAHGSGATGSQGGSTSGGSQSGQGSDHATVSDIFGKDLWKGPVQ